MFAELQRLGELRAQADLTRLPTLEEMDPEACYLSWTLELDGDIAQPQLNDIFDWVDARCKLEYTQRLRPADAVPEATAPGPDPAVLLPAPKAGPPNRISPQGQRRRRIDSSRDRETRRHHQPGRRTC